jgi:hypothetical protein
MGDNQFFPVINLAVVSTKFHGTKELADRGAKLQVFSALIMDSYLPAL